MESVCLFGDVFGGNGNVRRVESVELGEVSLESLQLAGPDRVERPDLEDGACGQRKGKV